MRILGDDVQEGTSRRDNLIMRVITNFKKTKHTVSEATGGSNSLGIIDLTEFKIKYKPP